MSKNITSLFPKQADVSLAKMINFINEAIVVFSSNGSIEIVNSMAANLLGASRLELLGESFLEFICDTNTMLKRQIIVSGQGSSTKPLNSEPQEVTMLRKDGSCVQVDISISQYTGQDHNDIQLYVCVLHDLTAHKAEYSVLRERATTDQLTGLANRHHFFDIFEQQWLRAMRESCVLSLIIIDVDYFKQINDTYGHITGDNCLKRIGETLKLSLPHRDALAARYGGEEFAILLPNCNAHIAQLLALRIKRHIAQLRFPALSSRDEAVITISVGVATYEQANFASKEAFLETADTLLYQAKSQGRNQICF